MKNFVKVLTLSFAIAVFCLLCVTNGAYAGIIHIYGDKFPMQTVKINAVFNPKTETISGSEIINYIRYNFKKKYEEKYRKIKKIGDKYKNFRGIYIKIYRNFYIMFYPNIFYKKPKNIKDFDFHQLYPYDFNRGYISIKSLSYSSTIHKLYKSYKVKIVFKTKIPQAIGNFGHFKQETVINAPFYPYISSGKKFNPQTDINFKVNLKIKAGYKAFFNGKIYKKNFFIGKRTNFISLIFAKKFIKSRISNVKTGLSIFFFQPYPYNFGRSNKKIDKAALLLDKYNMLKLKKINIVYVHLRRSLWLKPPLYSKTILISTRFGNIFPNFYIYQKLNIIKGLIYLNTVNYKKFINEISIGMSSYKYYLYSQELKKYTDLEFKTFLKKYINSNPNIKNIVKKFNFIQGVNTVINYPIFPLYYIYFTGFPRTHGFKNGVYYYNNDLNIINKEKIEKKILSKKKNDYYKLFLSSTGGNISPDSGRSEGYLNFTLTKKHGYRNGILFNIFKTYYGRGISIGLSHQLGNFFPVAQTYRQSIFGSINFMQISPSASGDSIIYQNTKRLTEFTVGYGYNSVDYNINPQYGSSFNFTYNIANSNIFSPFSFSQFMLQYVRNFKINADNIISVRGIGVFADGNVPEALDYYLGGINGIMGIPASEPFIGNDAVIAEADYERNIYRGLNLNLLDNLIDITAVTGNVIGGAGKLDDTVPSVIHKGVIYSFAGLGLHFKTYFFGIYPEMFSFYAAKAFGGRVGSEYGVRYYFGLNQPF